MTIRWIWHRWSHLTIRNCRMSGLRLVIVRRWATPTLRVWTECRQVKEFASLWSTLFYSCLRDAFAAFAPWLRTGLFITRSTFSLTWVKQNTSATSPRTTNISASFGFQHTGASISFIAWSGSVWYWYMHAKKTREAFRQGQSSIVFSSSTALRWRPSSLATFSSSGRPNKSFLA